MLSFIIYCKSHKRRPVSRGSFPLFRDTQAAIPAGWCGVCGGEIFEENMELCIRCRNLKGDHGYG